MFLKAKTHTHTFHCPVSFYLLCLDSRKEYVGFTKDLTVLFWGIQLTYMEQLINSVTPCIQTYIISKPNVWNLKSIERAVLIRTIGEVYLESRKNIVLGRNFGTLR